MPSWDSPCYSKPNVNMNKASGIPLFIERDKIFSDGFIKNDCIYIELEVGWAIGYVIYCREKKKYNFFQLNLFIILSPKTHKEKKTNNVLHELWYTIYK